VESVSEQCLLEERKYCNVLHLISPDGMNRITRDRVSALMVIIDELTVDVCGSGRPLNERNPKALIVTGNQHYFSVGADLNEIARLDAVEAFEFARMGQRCMTSIDNFPAPVYAAVSAIAWAAVSISPWLATFEFARPTRSLAIAEQPLDY